LTDTSFYTFIYIYILNTSGLQTLKECAINEVSGTVQWEENVLYAIKLMKANWIVHIMGRIFFCSTLVKEGLKEK